MKPTAIDMHSHYYGGLVDSLIRRQGRPNVSRNAQGRLVLNAMTASTEMSDGYTDIAARLSYMDQHRIATQLLTFPGALGIDVMPVAEVRAAIHTYNNHLSEICRQSGGRFVGLAGLPLGDLDLAVKELGRALHELGLAGAILPGNYFLSLDNLRLLVPLFEAAHSAGALLMVHPGLMPGEAPPAPFADTSVYRASVFQLQASLSQMAMSVLAAELCETYPKITFQLVNLGGTLPFVLERLEAVALSRPPHRPFPRTSLRGMVYDCASLGPRALELAVSVYGADRIMMGTDYPIFAPDQVHDTIESAQISDDSKALVLHGTAQRVLDNLIGR
ncbi:COG2159 Predicted metal-dependent hydrolase of the TIM-barrel fold [Rhabdaerophilaceae bacterium]